MTELDELVKRLRMFANPNTAAEIGYLWDACDEAADAITALRAERDDLLQANGELSRSAFDQLRETTALRERADKAEAELAASRDREAQMREALERIVAEAESDDGLSAWDGGDIAREALASPPAPYDPHAVASYRDIFPAPTACPECHGMGRRGVLACNTCGATGQAAPTVTPPPSPYDPHAVASGANTSDAGHNTPEEIEAAAKVAYMRNREGTQTWEDIGDKYRDEWRARVEPVVNAAFRVRALKSSTAPPRSTKE